MNIRKFRSDVDQLIAQGKELVTRSDDAKFLRKVTIVNLILNGMRPADLCAACGESVHTLTNWVKAVDEKGFEALRAKKQSGRPPKLSDEQKEAIKVALSNEPETHGYTIWDGPSLHDYILKTFAIDLGVRQCQRLMHDLGFSLIRPQTFPSKDNENDPRREDFKKN